MDRTTKLWEDLARLKRASPEERRQIRQRIEEILDYLDIDPMVIHLEYRMKEKDYVAEIRHKEKKEKRKKTEADRKRRTIAAEQIQAAEFGKTLSVAAFNPELTVHAAMPHPAPLVVSFTRQDSVLVGIFGILDQAPQKAWSLDKDGKEKKFDLKPEKDVADTTPDFDDDLEDSPFSEVRQGPRPEGLKNI